MRKKGAVWHYRPIRCEGNNVDRVFYNISWLVSTPLINNQYIEKVVHKWKYQRNSLFSLYAQF